MAVGRGESEAICVWITLYGLSLLLGMPQIYHDVYGSVERRMKLSSLSLFVHVTVPVGSVLCIVWTACERHGMFRCDECCSCFLIMSTFYTFCFLFSHQHLFFLSLSSSVFSFCLCSVQVCVCVCVCVCVWFLFALA